MTFPDVLADTGEVVKLKLPLLVPPPPMTMGGVGGFAAPLAMVTVTVNPFGGAGPLRTTMPVTGEDPPVAGLGLNVNDMIVAGFTVRVVFTLVPRVAVIVTAVCNATPTDVAVNG